MKSIIKRRIVCDACHDVIDAQEVFIRDDIPVISSNSDYGYRRTARDYHVACYKQRNKIPKGDSEK